MQGVNTMNNSAVSTPLCSAEPRVKRVMLDLLIALAPATVASIVFFGLKAAIMIAVCVVTSLLSEYFFNKLSKKPQTVGDLSAIVTGLLLALNLSTAVNLWQCVVGSVFAIVVIKCAFGGLGYNFANPAITAKVMLFIAFFSEATNASGTIPSTFDMLIGKHDGAIGATCAIALLLGGIYLLIRRVISWHIPVFYIATVFLFSFALAGDLNTALYHILGGSLLIGAIFMATDPVTSPKKGLGKIIFALGCAVITVLISFYGKYDTEGVYFAILIMNILTPYIDKIGAKKEDGGTDNE